MAAVALIAARMGSSRFPKKTLADLAGRPMLERLVERVRASRSVTQVVLATTDLSDDDVLEEWCKIADVTCFRGSSDDVLGRLIGAADCHPGCPIVEVLGDNPLVHSDLVDAALERYEVGDVEYVATVTNEYQKADLMLSRFPIGVRVQVISSAALRKCGELATAPAQREHATSFIADHPELFSTAFVEAAGPFHNCNRPELTFAVNHPQNLELMRHIYQRCYSDNANFSVGDAIGVFDANPSIHALMGEPIL